MLEKGHLLATVRPIAANGVTVAMTVARTPGMVSVIRTARKPPGNSRRVNVATGVHARAMETVPRTAVHLPRRSPTG